MENNELDARPGGWWITIATVAVYMAAWLIWPVPAFFVGCVTLAALLGFFYGVGRTLESAGPQDDARKDPS